MSDQYVCPTDLDTILLTLTEISAQQISILNSQNLTNDKIIELEKLEAVRYKLIHSTQWSDVDLNEERMKMLQELERLNHIGKSSFDAALVSIEDKIKILKKHRNASDKYTSNR